jgi:hypothetical protein
MLRVRSAKGCVAMAVFFLILAGVLELVGDSVSGICFVLFAWSGCCARFPLTGNTEDGPSQVEQTVVRFRSGPAPAARSRSIRNSQLVPARVSVSAQSNSASLLHWGGLSDRWVLVRDCHTSITHRLSIVCRVHCLLSVSPNSHAFGIGGQPSSSLRIRQRISRPVRVPSRSQG